MLCNKLIQQTHLFEKKKSKTNQMEDACEHKSSRDSCELESSIIPSPSKLFIKQVLLKRERKCFSYVLDLKSHDMRDFLVLIWT